MFYAESLTDDANASHANFFIGSWRSAFRSFLLSLPDVSSNRFRSL